MRRGFSQDERITDTVEPVFADLFTFGEFWVQWVGVYVARKACVECGVEVGDVCRFGEFFEGCSDEVEGWCVVPIWNQSCVQQPIGRLTEVRGL